MKKLVPHIAFNGKCEEAMDFYAAAFGGEVEFAMRYSESPMADQVPEEFGARIMHATFTAGAVHFMAADSMPGHEAAEGSNVDLSIEFDDADQQAGVFQRLSDGGEVKMPLQDTFWGAHFGMVKDKFGIGWMLNRELSKDGE